jgi:hypothetical protein
MAKNGVQEHKVSDEEKSMLSEEELAALQDEDDDADDDIDEDEDDADDEDADDEEEGDDEEEDDSAGDDEADKDGDKDKDKGKSDDKDKDKDKGKDGKKTDDDADDDDGDEPDARMPQYKIDEAKVTAAKTTLQGLEQKFTDLRKKFKDGDVDEDEYDQQVRALNSEERNAQKVIDRAELLTELNQTNKEETWEAAQDRFFGRKENKIFEDDLVFPMLQTAVNKVRATPAAEGKPYSWVLKQASDMVKQKIGHVDTATLDKRDGKKGKETAAGKELEKRRKAKSGEDIPSLHNKPAADANTDEYTGKFARLSGLKGMELEEAVASMSEADQMEWAEKG